MSTVKQFQISHTLEIGSLIMAGPDSSLVTFSASLPERMRRETEASDVDRSSHMRCFVYWCRVCNNGKSWRSYRAAHEPILNIAIASSINHDPRCVVRPRQRSPLCAFCEPGGRVVCAAAQPCVWYIVCFPNLSDGSGTDLVSLEFWRLKPICGYSPPRAFGYPRQIRTKDNVDRLGNIFRDACLHLLALHSIPPAGV